MAQNIENPMVMIGIPLAELKSQSTLKDIEIMVAKRICKNIQIWIENCESKPPAPNTRCQDCGQVSNFQSMQEGHVRTQFGVIRYERAYYLCPNCQHGTYPLDEKLNPIQSLARMRAKILAGKHLPVSEMAEAWGLGSLDFSAAQLTPPGEKYRSQAPLPGSRPETNPAEKNQNRFLPLLCQ